MHRLASRAARKVTSWLGWDLVPSGADPLARLASSGVVPRSVIDVGAALGDWSRAAARVFPDAHFLLVEPLDEFKPAVAATARTLKGSAAYVAAAGEAGERTLNVHRDLVGSSLLREREGAAVDGSPRTIPVMTVDTLVADHRLAGPFLLKLDVQGAELEVLRGAAMTLRDATAVVVEASFFSFWYDGSQFDQVITTLRSEGFVVCDLYNLARRPLDGALAQVDVVFIPDDSPVRTRHVYATAEQRAAQDDEFETAIRRRLSRIQP